MEVSVDYMDGRVVEFNTNDFVPGDPLKGAVASDRRAKNFVTEFVLRMDRLETDGLRMDIYYNTFGAASESDVVDMTDDIGPKSDGSPRTAPIAVRRLQGVVYLLTAEELEGAAYILVRRCSETVEAAWRQGSGNWLVDGMRFARTARQVYSDANITSKNQKLAIMMNYLNNAHPSLDEQDFCNMTGYPLGAWEEIRDMESANFSAAVGEDGDWVDGDDVPQGAANDPDPGDEDPQEEGLGTFGAGTDLAGDPDLGVGTDDDEPDSLIPEDQEFEDEDE